jgi:hypothetical protein
MCLVRAVQSVDRRKSVRLVLLQFKQKLEGAMTGLTARL